MEMSKTSLDGGEIMTEVVEGWWEWWGGGKHHIKHVKTDLEKSGVNKYHTPHTKQSGALLTNLQEPEDVAKVMWEKMPPEKCKKLIDGETKRLDAVIAAKGYW